jgi:hypothetical protein
VARPLSQISDNGLADLKPARSHYSSRPRRPTFTPPIEPPSRAEHTIMSRTQQVEHTDSISSQDPSREEPKKTKSKRPPSKPRLAIYRHAQKKEMLMGY